MSYVTLMYICQACFVISLFDFDEICYFICEHQSQERKKKKKKKKKSCHVMKFEKKGDVSPRKTKRTRENNMQEMK